MAAPQPVAKRIKKEDVEGIRPKLEPVRTPQRPPLHNGALASGSSFPKASGAMDAPAQVAKRIKEEDLEENGKAHRDKEGHVIFVVDIRKEHIFIIYVIIEALMSLKHLYV
jgi:hypothetical protein